MGHLVDRLRLKPKPPPEPKSDDSWFDAEVHIGTS
jgi:hypothetical protein